VQVAPTPSAQQRRPQTFAEKARLAAAELDSDSDFEPSTEPTRMRGKVSERA
jgi:hypothetical protein